MIEPPSMQLEPHLRPGERLLWSGRPDEAVTFSPSDAFLVPFSVMWGGFAVFWELSVVAGGAPFFFMLWGIPFVLMGLYFTLGRFIVKKRRKRITAYGITPERVLVAVGSRSFMDTPVKATPIDTRRSRDNRHVSITFANKPSDFGMGMYANTGMDFFMRGNTPMAFYDVADVESVMNGLDQARR